MARPKAPKAYFIADPQTAGIFDGWVAATMDGHDKLRSLAQGLSDPHLPGYAQRSLMDRFAQVAASMPCSLKSALGLGEETVMIETQSGFFMPADIAGERLGDKVVLIVDCHLDGMPCYKLPNTCDPISERAYEALKYDAWAATVGTASKLMWRALGYKRPGR